MNYTTIIDYFFRGITLIFFIILLYPIFFESQESKENSAIEANIRNLEKLPYLNDAQKRLTNIAHTLESKDIYMGSLRHVSPAKDRWVYLGARINIPKCIAYSDMKKIILDNGFNMDYKVKLQLTHASREEQIIQTKKLLLCESLYFDYSYQE